MALSDNQPLYGDADLLSLLWKDDRRGMEILFRSHYSGLYRFAYLIVNQRELAEDIVQEVFLNLWKVRHNLKINTAFKPYLYKASKNLALNKLRAARREKFVGQISEEIPDNALNIAEILESKQLSKYIKHILGSLPPRRRLIYHLSRDQEMTYTEIADYLDLSVKTIENQMSAALRTLRKQLEAYLQNQ